MDRPEAPEYQCVFNWGEQMLKYSREMREYANHLERKVRIYESCLIGIVKEKPTCDHSDAYDLMTWARTALNDGGD